MPALCLVLNDGTPALCLVSRKDEGSGLSSVLWSKSTGLEIGASEFHSDPVPPQQMPSLCSPSFFFRKGWNNDTCLLLPYTVHGDGDECVEILEGKQESNWLCVMVPMSFLWHLHVLGHSDGFARANSIKTGSLLWAPSAKLRPRRRCALVLFTWRNRDLEKLWPLQSHRVGQGKASPLADHAWQSWSPHRPHEELFVMSVLGFLSCKLNNILPNGEPTVRLLLKQAFQVPLIWYPKPCHSKHDPERTAWVSPGTVIKYRISGPTSDSWS